MNEKSTSWAEVDAAGRLVLPAEVTAQYGLSQGAQVRIDQVDNYIPPPPASQPTGEGLYRTDQQMQFGMQNVLYDSSQRGKKSTFC